MCDMKYIFVFYGSVSSKSLQINGEVGGSFQFSKFTFHYSVVWERSAIDKHILAYGAQAAAGLGKFLSKVIEVPQIADFCLYITW